MRSKGIGVAANRRWPLYGSLIWLLASLAVVSSCGEDGFSGDDDGDYFTSVEFLSKGSRQSGKISQPLCTIVGKTKSGKVEHFDMESYIAKVVTCENGGSHVGLEALKAQAVAARSWIRNFYREKGRGAIVEASQSHQVHECGRQPTALIKQAVAETAGQVLALANEDEVIAGLYVAGSKNQNSQCHGTGSGGSEVFVTYNEGKMGAAVKPAQRKFANPDNRFNRGTMSQNSSTCLGDKGYDYQRILRFFYGQDARIVSTPMCEGQGADVGIDSSQMPEPTASSPVTNNGACRGTDSEEGMPSIHSRAEWGAQSGKDMTDMGGKVTRITVHHAAGVRPKSSGRVPAALRQIQRGHFKRGFSDIGYHFAVDGQGGIWALRPESKMGAHAKGNNPHNIGIVLLGNFSNERVGNEEINLEMTKEQRDSLTKLIRYISKKYGFKPEYQSTLFGHKDLSSTACPGENVRKYLGEIAKAASADVVCEEPEVATNAPATQPERTTGYRKIRLTAIGGKYPVDTVLFNDGKTTNYAVSCTKGSQGTGEPDAKSCDSWKSNVVVLEAGQSAEWTFDKPFLPSDKVEVVQRSVPKSQACAFTDFKGSQIKVEIAGDDGKYQTVSEGADTFNTSQLTKANGDALDTFNNGSPAGGFSGILAGILGSPIFKLPGLIGDFVTNIVGIVNGVVDAVKNIDFKNIFNNISIGKDFKFEFNVGEKAASLEFYVNGELVAFDYNPKDGFSVKADVIKILGLNEVVAVVKDAAGKVIGATRAIVNKVKEAFAIASPMKDLLYGKNVNLKSIISDPKVQKVVYKYGGKLLCEAVKNTNFSCDAVLDGLNDAAKKIKVVAAAVDAAGNIIKESNIEFLASNKGSSVAMVTPQAGQAIPQKSILTADANDPSITLVKYLVDGKEVGSSASRKSGFAVPLNFDTDEAKNIKIEVQAYKGDTVVGSQTIDVSVAGKGGAVDVKAPVNDDAIAQPNDSGLAGRIAEEGKKAWVAGNGCFGGRDKYFSRTEVRNKKSGRKDPANKGYPRCSSPNFADCAGSQGLCYSAVKGALTRAKVAGVEGTCSSPSTTTVYEKIASIGSYNLSAAHFHSMAKANPTKFANTFGMKDVTSQLNTTRDAIPGDIVVWDAYCSRKNNSGKKRTFGQHGHIEIIVDSAKTACSDYCATVNQPIGACWHVYRAL